MYWSGFVGLLRMEAKTTGLFSCSRVTNEPTSKAFLKEFLYPFFDKADTQNAQNNQLNVRYKLHNTLIPRIFEAQLLQKSMLLLFFPGKHNKSGKCGM